MGLDYFTIDDEAYFFGREEDRKRIIGNFRVARLTLLYAESGVGKSSLLRAGVMPRLHELAVSELADRIPGVESPAFDLPVFFSSWAANPTQALSEAIREATRQFAPEPAPFPADSLDECIVAVTEAADADLLIILDQFEEYLTNRVKEGGDTEFPGQLASCINRPDLRVRFLISIREDAYAAVGNLLEPYIAEVFANYLHLDHLDEDEAREGIDRPVETWNALHPGDEPYRVERELREAVLAEVRRPTGGVETTYLQLVMKRIWDEEVAQQSHVLRPETFKELGGAEAIFQAHVDAALSKLTPEQREAAAEAFDLLVTPTGRKIAYSVGELAPSMDYRLAAVLDATLTELAAPHVRILRTVEESTRTFELFHDALSAPILDWLGRQQAEQRATELAHQREELAKANAQVRRERRRRIVWIVLSAVLAVVLVYGLVQRNQLENERSETESSTLAARSLTELTNPEKSLRLAKRAIDLGETPAAMHAARAVLGKPYIHDVFPNRLGDPRGVKVAPLRNGRFVVAGERGAWIWHPGQKPRPFDGFGDGVATVSTSGPRDRILVVGRYSAQVFDDQANPLTTNGTEAKIIEPLSSDFVAGAISREGDRIALVERAPSREVRVVDPTGSEIGSPLRHASRVDWVDWLPGPTLLTQEYDAVTLWSENGTPRRFPGASSYAITRDGTFLATGTSEGIIQVWRWPDLTPVASFRTGANPWILSDPERGGKLVVVDVVGNLWEWDPTRPEQPRIAAQSGYGVNSVSVPAAPFLMSSGPGAVSIWDTHAGSRVERFDVPGSILAPRLSNDGTYSFLQVDVHGELRRWTGRTGGGGLALGDTGARSHVVQMAIDQDRDHILVAYQRLDRFLLEVRTFPALIPLASSEQLVVPRGADSGAVIDSLFFDTDARARRLVTLAQQVGDPSAVNIEVWNPVTGERVRELQSRFPNGDVDGFSVSPDGTMVVVTGNDHTRSSNLGYVELIPVDGAGKAEKLDRSTFERSVQTAEFSRDGRYLVLGRKDGSTWVRNLEHPERSERGFRSKDSKGHHEGVTAVAISSDGSLVATGGDHGRVVVWDRATASRIRSFDIGQRVEWVDFGDHGRLVMADGPNVPTRVFSTRRNKDDNPIRLIHPVPEPAYQSAAMVTTRAGSEVVSSDGRYIVRYPCLACVSETTALATVERRWCRLPGLKKNQTQECARNEASR